MIVRAAIVRRIAGAVLAALTAGGASAETGATAKVRALIQAQIDDSTEATRTKDIARYMRAIPPDLAIKKDDGTAMTRDELRADQLQQWSVIEKTLSIAQRIDRLAVAGDAATVWTSQRWHRLMHERKGPKLDDVVTTEKHEEHWRRVGGRWWCYDVKELGGEIFIDGKPYKR